MSWLGRETLTQNKNVAENFRKLQAQKKKKKKKEKKKKKSMSVAQIEDCACASKEAQIGKPYGPFFVCRLKYGIGSPEKQGG